MVTPGYYLTQVTVTAALQVSGSRHISPPVLDTQSLQPELEPSGPPDPSLFKYGLVKDSNQPDVILVAFQILVDDAFFFPVLNYMPLMKVFISLFTVLLVKLGFPYKHLKMLLPGTKLQRQQIQQFLLLKEKSVQTTYAHKAWEYLKEDT